MARRRLFKKLASRGRSFARRSYRAASKAQPSLMTQGLYGFGYGAARPMLLGLVNSVVPNFAPLGNLNDEVKLGLAGWAAAKYGSGIIRNVGKTALIVEAAAAGSTIVGGTVGTQVSTMAVTSPIGGI